MADYGLDPSVLSYVQGGGMPPVAAPMPSAPDPYGLPPQVVNGITSGFDPQQIASTLGPKNADSPAPIPPTPVAAPIATSTLGPRGRNNIGVNGGIAGDEIAAPVDEGPASVTGGTLPTQDASVQASAPTSAPIAPDQTIATANVPSTDKQVAAANKQYDAAQAKQTAYENSPEGLAAHADAMNQQAIEKERSANADASAAQQAQDVATAAALKASNARQAQQDQLDAAKRAQDQATTQKYADQYAQQVKDAANFKVNTDRHIGAGGLIAIALSGIGQALDHQHGPNTAFQIISEAQDKQIADQWAKKRALGEDAAGTKSLLDTSRQQSVDDRTDMDLQRAAEAKRSADEVRQIAAQYKSPQDKAQAEAVAAGLDQKSATLVQGAAQRKLEAQKTAQEQANERARIGVSYGQLKLGRDQLTEQTREHDLQRQDNLDKLEKDYIAMGNKALADKAKELKTSGIFDPNTAAPLIDASDPAAQPALLQAKRLDQQAAAATDPAQQQALAKQASDLRKNVSVQYGATLDKEDRDKIIGAQRLVNTTQRIRDALEDGSITDRDTRAALKTEADNAFTAWAETNKVKASSREYEVYKEAIGQIDGISSTNVNKGPLKASLDALDKGTQNLVGSTLRGHGIKAVDANGNPWVMTAEKPPQATQLLGTTAAEAGDNATPGVAAGLNPFGSQGFAARGGRAAARAVFGGSEPDPTLVAENSADVGPTGLARADDAKVLGLIKTYGKVSPDENQRVVSNIVNVVGDPGDDPRKQALANATITRVKAESPQLYQKVLDALPNDRRKQLTQFDLPPVVLDHIQGRK